jgi:hypothetical protein
MSADEAIMVSVDDYEELINKPSIAGVELTGNKSLDDLGAYTKAQVDTKLSAKADKSEIPNLNGYATESWVENKHYLTEHQSLEGYATEEWVEGKHYLTTAPVESVNGKTGAVTVTEGLAPLIGTTATVTPQQVMTALGEGRDICITAESTLNGIPIAIKFTSFNRATDKPYSGQAFDMVVSQTIAYYSAYYLFELVGGVLEGDAYSWQVVQTILIDTTELSDVLTNYVPSGRTINDLPLTGNITLTASDVGALPSSTAIPTKTSDLTNDSHFITLADLPIYNGSVS